MDGGIRYDIDYINHYPFLYSKPFKLYFKKKVIEPGFGEKERLGISDDNWFKISKASPNSLPHIRALLES